MTVRLTASSVGDLTEIRDHYRSVGDELEQRFLEHLDLAIDRLRTFPNGAALVDGFPGIRRARIRRFPFGVFYRIDGEVILVLRVLHTRRGTFDIG